MINCDSNCGADFSWKKNNKKKNIFSIVLVAFLWIKFECMPWTTFLKRMEKKVMDWNVLQKSSEK